MPSPPNHPGVITRCNCKGQFRSARIPRASPVAFRSVTVQLPCSPTAAASLRRMRLLRWCRGTSAILSGHHRGRFNRGTVFCGIAGSDSPLDGVGRRPDILRCAVERCHPRDACGHIAEWQQRFHEDRVHCEIPYRSGRASFHNLGMPAAALESRRRQVRPLHVASCQDAICGGNHQAITTFSFALHRIFCPRRTPC